MSARKRINKTKFYAINRDIKSAAGAVGAAKTIASVHNVSEETVRTVKRAKTWPRFEEMKRLKNEKRRPSAIEAAPIAVPDPSALGVPMAQAVENATKSLDKITQASENQIRPVPSEEIKVVTVAEWDALNRKLGRLYQMIEQKQRKPLLSILGRRK